MRSICFVTGVLTFAITIRIAATLENVPKRISCSPYYSWRICNGYSANSSGNLQILSLPYRYIVFEDVTAKTLEKVTNCKENIRMMFRFARFDIIKPNVVADCSQLQLIRLADVVIESGLDYYLANATSVTNVEITRSKLATTNIAKGISNLPAILNLRITYNDFGHDKPDVKLLFDRRITSLLYMDISGNRLSSLSERAFINCGWLRKLVANNNQIYRFSSQTFLGLSMLELLNITGNRIANIDADAFHPLQKLKILNLESNFLISISTETIMELSSLNYLILGSNRIFNYSYGALRPLHKLQILKLPYNQLTVIGNEFLKSASSLTEIDLENNNIEKIMPIELNNLTNARIISLANNKIKILREITFFNLSNLEKIDLENNRIGQIEDNAFSNLSNLLTLKLSLNKIKSLGQPFSAVSNLKQLYLDLNFLSNPTDGSMYTFQNLTKLEILDLSGNRLTKIDKKLFYGLNSLKYLYLANNHISYIEFGTFQNLEKLVHLSTEQNQLVTINGNQFRGLRNVHQLNFAGNPIRSIALNGSNGYSQLRSLNLRGTFLHSMDKLSLNNLPKLEIIDLYRNKIKVVRWSSGFVDANLVTIDLSSNGVSSVASINQLCSVRTLNLSFNQVLSIAKLQLKNLTCLTTMHLSFNLVHKIEENDVSNAMVANKIRSLDISNNRLQYMHPLSFKSCKMLKTMYINNNGIKNLDFLKFVPSLEKLLARSNKINTLSHKIFNPLKNLKTLDVSSNPIHHLSYEAFSKLSNLYNLYLENIRLRRLDQINLTNSSNLQSLILRNNEITDLQRRNFEGLRELRLLDLSKNGISYIPNDTFVPLKNLTTLLFDDNRLTEFDASIICENTNIKELSFQSNQIHTMVDKSCIGGYKRLNIINFNNNSLDDRFSRALNAIKSEVLINLYDLNIGRNKIAHFPEVLLRATKSNLRFINIGFNKIGRIDVTKIISGFQYFNYIECKTNKRRICRYYSLNIAGSNLSYLESGTFAHIQDSMGALNLNDNKLKRLDISDLVNITNDILKHLHLANNYLTTITTKNNIQLKALSHLNLINNKIIDICWGSSLSTGAPNVQNLQVDNNGIKILRSNCFFGYTKLYSVSLIKNPLVQVSAASFLITPKLKQVFSTREYLCCIVPPTVSYCTPYIEQDAFTTCSDILSHQSLQLFVWVVGSLALVGNAIVIYFQIFKVKKSSEPVPAMLITNLAFSDLMMAGYILIIGSVDLFYRNYYAANAEIWLRSFTCILACFLCCTASLMSVFMMITISIDRYIYIAFPYSNKNLSPSLTKWIITILWIFSIVFVSIPVGYSINANGDMRLYEYTSICMASNYNNYYYRIWLISYVVITLICWLITCFLYVHMFIAIYKTSKAVSAVSHNNSKRIAIRLFAIVITDLISWLPYYVYMAQIMVKPTIAGSVVLQFAIVLALPINSAINPYLYTVSSPTFIRSAKHRIIKWGCVTRIVPNNTKEIEIGINKDENIGLRTFSSKSNDNITASTKDCLSK